MIALRTGAADETGCDQGRPQFHTQMVLTSAIFSVGMADKNGIGDDKHWLERIWDEYVVFSTEPRSE